VSWGIDDIDLHPSPSDSAGFSANGDSTLPFDGTAIHNPILVVSGNQAALLEQGIYQGSFSMVDVSDDGYVPNMLILFNHQ
jgi:hypothetical protein